MELNSSILDVILHFATPSTLGQRFCQSYQLSQEHAENMTGRPGWCSSVD